MLAATPDAWCTLHGGCGVSPVADDRKLRDCVPPAALHSTREAMLCCARILGIVEVNIGLQMQQDREAANAIEQVNAFVPVRPQRKLKDQRGDHEQDRHAPHEHAHARMGEALASEWSGNAAEMASRPLVRVRVCLSSCLAETNSGRAPLLPSTHWRECRRTMATPCSQSSHSRMLLALRCKRAAPRCIMLQHATWGVAGCRARAAAPFECTASP